MEEKMATKETKVAEVNQKLEDITECSICISTYKEPKVLPCIHTFCLNCLQQTGETSCKTPGERMPCPLCRKEFTIPETGFDGLQKNFFIERMIEIKQMLNPSDNPVDVLCEECMEGNETGGVAKIPPAEVHCVDCCQKLCSECHKHHKKSKLSRHHKIIDLDVKQSISKKENLQNVCLRFCEEHKEKTLDLYCHNCDVVVCSTCFVESHHSHQGSDVNKIANEFRQEIQNNVEEYLSQWLRKFEDVQNDVDNSYSAFIQNVGEIEVSVNRGRNEMKELVDKHADSLLYELQSVKQQRSKEREMTVNDIKTRHVNLESFMSYCMQIATVGSAVDVCREINGLRKKGRDLGECSELLTTQWASKPFPLLLKKTNSSNLLLETENLIGKLEVSSDTEESLGEDKTELMDSWFDEDERSSCRLGVKEAFQEACRQGRYRRRQRRYKNSGGASGCQTGVQ